jgi:hypothetical protein
MEHIDQRHPSGTAHSSQEEPSARPEKFVVDWDDDCIPEHRASPDRAFVVEWGSGGPAENEAGSGGGAWA